MLYLLSAVVSILPQLTAFAGKQRWETMYLVPSLPIWWHCLSHDQSRCFGSYWYSIHTHWRFPYATRVKMAGYWPSSFCAFMDLIKKRYTLIISCLKLIRSTCGKSMINLKNDEKSLWFSMAGQTFILCFYNKGVVHLKRKDAFLDIRPRTFPFRDAHRFPPFRARKKSLRGTDVYGQIFQHVLKLNGSCLPY